LPAPNFQRKAINILFEHKGSIVFQPDLTHNSFRNPTRKTPNCVSFLFANHGRRLCSSHRDRILQYRTSMKRNPMMAQQSQHALGVARAIDFPRIRAKAKAKNIVIKVKNYG